MSLTSSEVVSTADMIRDNDSFNTILMFSVELSSTDNAYFLSRNPQDNIVIEEVCKFCEGVNIFVEVNTWNKDRGFKSKFKLAESFKGQFYGNSLSYYFYSQS